MVMGLHPSCGDREVYEFFSKEAGKVRDLYVVRDPRTGKSRGVAYVEFYLQDSILKALACNGRMIHGHGPIRVQASGAEKNRAAVAQREATVSMQDKPIVLYVMGLNGILTEMTESELKSLFLPFGDIEYANIGRCPYTGRGRGYAKILFAKAADAREAMACMNGFQLAGQTFQVGYLSGSLGDASRSSRAEDPDLLKTNQDRARVMVSLMNRR
jgi:RNA-binding protein 39